MGINWAHTGAIGCIVLITSKAQVYLYDVLALSCMLHYTPYSTHMSPEKCTHKLMGFIWRFQY